MKMKNKSDNSTKITNSSKVYLEKPIEDNSSDVFDLSSYVNQLKFAIKNGATFIAIDGEHGSGKSSVVNLLKKELESENQKFVNINFLNINESDKRIKNDSKNYNEVINNYHRYFVNQVANDIYSNPYEIEKLFYSKFFSAGISKKKSNTKNTKLINFFLKVGILYITVFSLGYQFFEVFKLFGKYEHVFLNYVTPVVFISTLLLMIKYGYEISKPEESMQSPMLDIDRTRNNFCKVIFDKLDSNSSLYLIIDDLDRIDAKIQIRILSLLFNEYYPLKIKDINIVFLCMININKLNNQKINNNVDCEKLFDYIQYIANNQKFIIRQFIKKTLEEDPDYKNWYETSKNRDYLIGLICENFTSIRSVKHFFNRIIDKKKYLETKEISEINYDTIILTTILTTLGSSFEISKLIEARIIESTKIVDSDSYKIKKMKTIINESMKKDMINNNYYIYLYNFINNQSLLNETELKISNMLDSYFDWLNENESEKINNLLNNSNVRFEKIYYELFLYVNNDAKLLLLTNKNFCEYIISNIPYIDVSSLANYKDLYLNTNASKIYDNLFKGNYMVDKNILINNLIESRNAYIMIDTVENKNKYLSQIKYFVKGFEKNIIEFNLKELFDKIIIDPEIFELFFEKIQYKSEQIGYELLEKDIIKFSDIESYINENFIEKLDSISHQNRMKIKKILLNFDIKMPVFLKIILSEKIDSINVYEKLNSYDQLIDEKTMEELLKIYDYSEQIDNHIINFGKDDKYEIANFLNDHKYEISSDILKDFDEQQIYISYSEYHELKLIEKGLYRPFVYSQIIRMQSFYCDKKLLKNKEYKNALLIVYAEISSIYSKLLFTNDYAKVVIDNIDLDSINFSYDNYWKIIALSKYVTDAFVGKIVEKLNKIGKLEEFCDFISKRSTEIPHKQILTKIYVKSSQYISPVIKRNLTKKINSYARR